MCVKLWIAGQSSRKHGSTEIPSGFSARNFSNAVTNCAFFAAQRVNTTVCSIGAVWMKTAFVSVACISCVKTGFCRAGNSAQMRW